MIVSDIITELENSTIGEIKIDINNIVKEKDWYCYISEKITYYFFPLYKVPNSLLITCFAIVKKGNTIDSKMYDLYENNFNHGYDPLEEFEQVSKEFILKSAIKNNIDLSKCYKIVSR